MMISSHSLLSAEGFNYLASIRPSKAILENVLSELSSGIDLSTADLQLFADRDKARLVKKGAQLRGFLSLLDYLVEEGDSILEVGAGAAHLLRETDARYSQSQVKGAEIQEHLVEKECLLDYVDVFNDTIEDSYDVITGLHLCGSLTDKAIDIAIEKDAKLLVAPCCYGKIDSIDLPRSRVISANGSKALFKEVKDNTISLESDNKTMLPDWYRLLFNFDRLLYLKENGFSATYIPFADKFNTGSRSLNYAILASPKN